MAKALITGITGQDGSYLADHLLQLGYEVHGIVRRSSSPNPWRIAHLEDRVTLWDGDMLDMASLLQVLDAVRPTEIYNLAAQSFVGRSWREPVYTAEVNGVGALRLFEAARVLVPQARIYQASTSEMYGNLPSDTITARGPFAPRSPYGNAKLFAHTSAVNMRESHGQFVACGILFNHESPRRGEEFVTRKVTRGAALAKLGRIRELPMGNLEARRDWGWAPDYVRAMHLLLQHDEPVDVMVATGRSHSVRELCEAAFSHVGLDYRDVVTKDPRFFRPAEVDALLGDPTDAERLLGWKPQVTFEEMVRRMVDADLADLQG